MKSLFQGDTMWGGTCNQTKAGGGSGTETAASGSSCTPHRSAKGTQDSRASIVKAQTTFKVITSLLTFYKKTDSDLKLLKSQKFTGYPVAKYH